MRHALALILALGAGAALVPGEAQAVGCLSGAAIGGVAGHAAGHHALLGAAAGCAVGHHAAVKRNRAAAAQQSQQQAQPAQQ